MPFISQAYLQYLEEQFGAASGQGQAGGVDIPPANPSATPTTAPDLSPGLGGPTVSAAGAPGNVPQWPTGVLSVTPGTTPGSTATYPNTLPPNPWAPPPPPQYGNVPGSNQPLLPPPTDVTTGPLENVTGGTTPSGGQGDRQDDSGKVPGVDLTWRDRVNMGLHNFGLPPLPTGYNPFGGLPPGFSEGNRFGGGAPIFTPPNFSGPNWTPGGSIFGGTMNPNMNLAGSWYGLGAGPGGTLPPGMANLYLHSGRMQDWAQNQGFNNIGDWMRNTGFSLSGGWPGAGTAQTSGAGLSGAGRPMTVAR